MATSSPIGVLIDAPLPRAPLYNLIGSAAVVPDPDPHVFLGVAVRGYPCGAPSAWEWCTSDGPKDVAGVFISPDFKGFVVYYGVACNARGVDPAEFAARARDRFAAVETIGVERELWGAGATSNPSLLGALGDPDASTYPAGSTAQNPVEALALLEQAIADETSVRGMIHCTPAVATYWASRQLLQRQGGTPPTLQTMLGTVVVPGYGYGGGAPDGQGSAPTGKREWAFATGPVEIRRGDVYMIPDDESMALDRSTNTLTYYVERPYVLDWDTCSKSGVLVDRSL